ncbi:UBX domain-containing protein 1 isoform X2 [Dendrobium catenatum]|uniref:UBX domain-containing protein 1 isoform X2 n=1 Tax=Dendrobium catenatum TaxID=906689 RepID=UPI0009F71E19|nr:UBX domain-containing protein 1 isoform X2 [Dendrobium catenatum]
MAALGIDKRMLRELESMGFPTIRATRALYYSGNSSIEDAINWVLEHEGDSDIDHIPKVPIDIQIESGEPLHTGEDMEMKLKDLREQVRKKREDDERRMEREQEKERIRRGKRLMEDKRSEKENERQRIIAFRKAEKEEEMRARQKIRQQLELDKAERRRKLGLPPENPRTGKPTPLPIREGNAIKGPKSVIPSMEETLKDCLRSLKKNHKDDDAKVKKAFQTLLTYVANVVRNPDNEKYRKIRLSNPLFQDRVAKFKEGLEFLELCGFHKLEGNEFLYMPRSKVEMTILNSAGLALNSALTNPYFGMLSL